MVNPVSDSFTLRVRVPTGVNVDVVEAVCAAGKAARADLAAATGAARK